MDTPHHFRRAVGAALEAGAWSGVTARTASWLWGHAASRALVRPETIDAGVAVVTVGGATIGGSGKTRVAIAVARRLASRGARVVLVGHAYGAGAAGRPSARIVEVTDPVSLVGDEALVCARSLRDTTVRVVVAGRRRAAIQRALSSDLAPDVLVFDGPLRLRRVRGPSLSILAVDRVRPWGSGRVPPAGDLRAPPGALLECADVVCEVDGGLSFVDSGLSLVDAGRVGLFTALARPARLLRALAAAGIPVQVHVAAPDHGPLTARERRALAGGGQEGPDIWLATEKCALHLEDQPLGAPLAVLGSADPLPASIDGALDRVCARPTWNRP